MAINSFIGIVAILFVAFLLSDNKRAINLRSVSAAFILQIGIAAFVLYSDIGRDFLTMLAGIVNFAIVYSSEGIAFVFGDLANVEKSGFVFAVHVLSAVIFFSSLMSVLYYLGLMQKVIAFIGGFIRKLLDISEAESANAAANIFVGMAEAPLVIRPYINTLSRSELFAVMTGGLATVAGALMAGYAAIGVDLNYLIAASFMAAPGGLLMAKLMVPEVEERRATDLSVHFDDSPPANIIDAAASGAVSGMKLAVNIGAMLLAFISLIALVNGLIGVLSHWAGFETASLQQLLGFLLAPLAFLLGVPWSESAVVGSLIGEKIILNEFVAYIDFVRQKDGLSAISQAIVTFALCGFANLASIAICLGSLASIAPSRRPDIAALGFRAFVAATLANLMSAAMAGFFLSFS